MSTAYAMPATGPIYPNRDDYRAEMAYYLSKSKLDWPTLCAQLAS